MNIQLKRYIDPVVNFWKKLSKKRKIIILSSFGGIVFVAVIVEILLSRPSYTVLYPDLSSSDEVTDVCNQLKSMNVDYKVDGNTISIPKDKEDTTRMQLANEGYPKSSLNYDFFTGNVNAMTTDSERKIIEKYQLNQRLESVIKTFDSIQNASVTINIPDDNAYAWDTSSSSSSASVTVTLASGKTLTASQVNGIKQLVAKSVPNLTTDNVAVINTATGNEMSGDSASDSGETAVDISEFKRTIEKEYEDDVAANALKVLKPLFGDGNVQVTAKSVMDVDKKVSEILTYIPSTDNKGVISQSSSDQETEKGTGATGTTSAVGAQSNTESSSASDSSTSYAGVTVSGDTIYTKDQQTYNYLVSQTKEQIQGDAASLKDMTISVVVNQETMGDAQKADIGKLVAYAAAIDPSKVTVYSSLFADQSAVNADANAAKPMPNLLYLAAGAGVIGLLLIALIVLWILSASRKRRLNRLITENMAMNAAGEPAGAPGGAPPENAAEISGADEGAKGGRAEPGGPPKSEVDEMSDTDEEEKRTASERKQLEVLHEAQRNRENELRKDLQEFASQNPEIVAQLIRSWLRGDDNNG